MMLSSITLQDEHATAQLASDLACQLEGGDVIALWGDLGAGKTTFCRYLLRALGHEGIVKSPTYTLVETYALSQWSLHHFDLYRLEDPSELEYMGWRDYLNGHDVLVIEWPQRAGQWLSEPSLTLNFDISGENQRQVSWQTALKKFKDLFAK